MTRNKHLMKRRCFKERYVFIKRFRNHKLCQIIIQRLWASPSTPWTRPSHRYRHETTWALQAETTFDLCVWRGIDSERTWVCHRTWGSLSRYKAYLDLDGPGEVADINEEGDVWVVAEVKVLVGEAVFELLDVAPRHDGNLLSGLRACWRTRGQAGRTVRPHDYCCGCSTQNSLTVFLVGMNLLLNVWLIPFLSISEVL